MTVSGEVRQSSDDDENAMLFARGGKYGRFWEGSPEPFSSPRVSLGPSLLVLEYRETVRNTPLSL